jgi:ABC-type transport system substrate-binding protein
MFRVPRDRKNPPMTDGSESERRFRATRSRALSPLTAAVILAVVVIMIGAGAYFLVGSTAPAPSNVTKVSCAPPTSPGCAGFAAGGHGLSVLVPFKTAQTGQVIPFTVLLSSGTASSFSFDFGDGTHATGTASTASHVYHDPGTYLVQASAVVGGQTEDNLGSLVTLTITASYASLSAGNVPSIGGQILRNTTTNSTPSAVLSPGGTLQVSGTYLGLPTNPDFAAVAPTLSVVGPSAAHVTQAATNTTVSGTYTFPASGTYVASVVGNSTGIGPDQGQSATTRYNWTVIVAPQGVRAALAPAAASATDPHPGTVIYYNSAPGGAQSLDPSIAYDSVSYELLLNVYEGLIMYNGSQTGPEPSNYLPVLATCVPGPNSASCAHLYGGNTLYDNATAAYTFPIAKNAKFYDPNTGAGWSVYPSDVAFSLARTASFADLPAKGAHNGWILAQAILPGPASATFAANAHWDNGIHYPYNNTPQAIFSSLAVNDSTYCTAQILSSSNGCVTIFAHGNDQPWPYFLELIADQQGASIESCGWASSATGNGGQSALPGWAADASGSDVGDHPCALPGGATASTDASLGTWLNSTSPTAWDAYQEAGSGFSNGGGSLGQMIKSMVGSGPYYLAAYQPSISYELKANPDYAPNAACTWTNCMPPVGHFAKVVEETWETNIAQGEQALASGVADTATIPATDIPFLVQLIQQGKAQTIAFPSLSIYFYPFNLDFQLSGAEHYTTNPITVPSDFFTYVGMRQFFATAYDYQTTISTIQTDQGIQAGFNYGGAIPQFMANYYPTNVSWPSQDPSQACSGSGANTPLCPTYWWTQMTTPSSPYYDPEATACSTTSPCQVPLVGETGAPTVDEQNSLWSNSLSQFSGGKLKVTYQDINFANLVINSLFSAPYQNPMPVYTLGWAPDYPDPTDYVVPLYLPDSTYTASDAVWEQLSHLNGSACQPSSPTYYVNNPVNETCQGAAFRQMNQLLAEAAVLPAGAERVLYYAMAEQIANKLALYVYQFQQNEIFSLAPWDNPTSIDTNVTIGGGTDFLWWMLSGAGVWG